MRSAPRSSETESGPNPEFLQTRSWRPWAGSWVCFRTGSSIYQASFQEYRLNPAISSLAGWDRFSYGRATPQSACGNKARPPLADVQYETKWLPQNERDAAPG